MNGLGNVLMDFDTIGLEQMDRVRFMNRTECKYVISGAALGPLLNTLGEDYVLVEIKDRTIMPYKSRYYDSRDFRLYTAHQNGKLNRYKVRSRTYALTGTTFMELKFKSNKRRTMKERVEVSENYNFIDSEYFLKDRLPFDPSILEEKIQINYNRITLVDKGFSERVTIDTNLNFISPDKKSDYDNLVIVEVKREGSKKTSLIEKKLKDCGVKPFSLSKYCLGISLHYADVKKNLINIKIKNLNRIIDPVIRKQKTVSFGNNPLAQKRVI